MFQTLIVSNTQVAVLRAKNGQKRPQTAKNGQKQRKKAATKPAETGRY